MKWSALAHTIAGLSAFLGVLTLFGAWGAGETGRFLGFSQTHLFSDAQSLFLASIAFGIGGLYHQREGK